MPSRNILKDTVVLYNYIGEVNDVATYQETILTRCYCPSVEGIQSNMQGKKSSNSARFYFFDAQSDAKSPDGAKRTYLPYKQWIKATDKTKYWTISDSGLDFFKTEHCNDRLRIIGFSHKKTGTRRMWHFEIDGR